MNVNMTQPIPLPIARNETLWLDLYSDGELDSKQEALLFEHLERTNGWKKCILHLSHERTLAFEMKNAVGRTRNAASNTANVPSAKSTTADLPGDGQLWPTILAACIAFVLGAGVVWFSVGDKQGSDVGVANSLMGVEKDSASVESELSPIMKLVSHRSADSSLTFFEIEDTPVRATYYLQKPLPELFLQALVLAGHTVEVNQEMMAIEDSNGSSKMLPINILEIKKDTNISF